MCIIINLHGRLLDINKPRLTWATTLLHLDFVCSAVWYRWTNSDVETVQTLPVGFVIMSADSIVKPRGRNIWDFSVVKWRRGRLPVSSTYVRKHCCNISKTRGTHARKSRVAGQSSCPSFWRGHMVCILSWIFNLHKNCIIRGYKVDF